MLLCLCAQPHRSTCGDSSHCRHLHAAHGRHPLPISCPSRVVLPLLLLQERVPAATGRCLVRRGRPGLEDIRAGLLLVWAAPMLLLFLYHISQSLLYGCKHPAAGRLPHHLDAHMLVPRPLLCLQTLCLPENSAPIWVLGLAGRHHGVAMHACCAPSTMTGDWEFLCLPDELLAARAWVWSLGQAGCRLPGHPCLPCNDASMSLTSVSVVL